MSKKDYKRGMADAMKAYEDFGEKQEAAIRHVGEEIEKTAGKVDRLGGKIGEITDYISDQEKAALYKLNTPVDIADLDDAEKRILLAVLYQLSTDAEELTEEQQNFVRAVQQYLKIYNPQTEIDLEAVENIEDISTQKAVLQTVLEFFYLGTHPGTYSDDQMDFLDCFQVNRKTRREINGYISAIVEAVGIKGLSEKYGFVAAQPRSEFARYKDNGPIPEKVADLFMSQKGLAFFYDQKCFIETKDYLVYCKKPSYTDPWGPEDAENGFYCMAKQTGKIERINIDYKKDFPFHYVRDLRFCVYENIIYFIENKRREGYSQLIAIDFEKKNYQLLPFKYPGNCNEAVFHLSANKSYVMIYMYRLPSSSDSSAFAKSWEERVRRPFSKIQVIDLTQGNRIFILESDLIVEDAFIFENDFWILGRRRSENSEIAFFEYDIAHKTFHEKFISANEAKLLDRFEFENFAYKVHACPVPTWSKGWWHILEQIWHVDDSYYILLRGETEKLDYGMNFLNSLNLEPESLYLLALERTNTQKSLYTRKNICGGVNILRLNDFILCTTTQTFFRNMELIKYDFATGEAHVIESNASSYILVGDYLYKNVGSEWWKTNISNGVENLQWEVFISP